MLYVGTSALLKRYIEEAESAQSERHLLAEPAWITARHTQIEVRGNLARLVPRAQLRETLELFERDWDRFFIVELDRATCERASEVAQATGARTLDALHLPLRFGSAAAIFVISLSTFAKRKLRERLVSASLEFKAATTQP